MDLKDSLKIEALEEKQDLEDVVKLFEGFREYVGFLLKFLKSEITDLDLERHREAYRLRIEEEEHRFLEWREGDQVWNPSIANLVFSYESYGNLDTLAHDILLSTVKFEYLLDKGKRELLKLHEKIEVLADATEAEKITGLDSNDKKKPLAEKVKVGDQYLEMGFKWGKRAIQIAPGSQQYWKSCSIKLALLPCMILNHE